MIGAGVQGHSHLPVIAHLLPKAELSIYNSRPERAATLAGAAARMGFAPCGSRRLRSWPSPMPTSSSPWPHSVRSAK